MGGSASKDVFLRDVGQVFGEKRIRELGTTYQRLLDLETSRSPEVIAEDEATLNSFRQSVESLPDEHDGPRQSSSNWAASSVSSPYMTWST